MIEDDSPPRKGCGSPLTARGSLATFHRFIEASWAMELNGDAGRQRVSLRGGHPCWREDLALQLLPVHFRVPAAGASGLRAAGAMAGAPSPRGLSGAGLLGLLWLVELEIPGADCLFHPVQFRMGPGRAQHGAWPPSDPSHASASAPGAGHRGEPRCPGVLQIRRFPCHFPQRRPGVGLAGAGHHPAIGHFILHLRADYLLGGCLSRRVAEARLP
jgi:hypothetical protein